MGASIRFAASASMCVFVLALGAPSTGQTLVQRINCGGSSVVNANAVTYGADLPYVATVQNGFEGGFSLPVLSGFNGDFIGGFENPSELVYAVGRVDWSAYRFEVPNGDYVVRMLIAEIYNQGVGLRELNVTVEGVTALSGFDVALEHGIQYGAEFVFEATVTDGRLDIEAAAGPGECPEAVEGPLVCGLEIWSKDPIVANPSTVAGLAVHAGYHRNFMTWDWNLDPNVESFRVYRSNTAGGSYALIDTVAAAPPRYFDDTATLGQEHFYRVTAVDVDGNESAQNTEQSATAMDSADSDLPVYELTISAPNLEFIAKNILTNPSEEVSAAFTHDGVPYNAETRYRGSSSRRVSKKSWEVDFPPNDEFQGRRDLNLKASFIDPSMIRERVGAELFRAMGQTLYEIQPVHLLVNGEYLGVFNRAEQLDDDFIAKRNRDPGMVLYKTGAGNMMTLSTLANYEAAYEIETNTSEGHADLVSFIEFLEPAPGSDFLLELADQFDLDQYLTYLAVVTWVADIDTIQRNYYLAHDLDLERWEFYPWDSDVTMNIVVGLEALDILYGTSALTSNPNLIHQLRERVLGDDALLWRFCEKLKELDTLEGSQTAMDARIDAFTAEVATDALADPFAAGWEDPTLFLGDDDVLKDFVASRSAFVLTQVATIQPSTPPTAVWLNEVQASPQTGFQDEASDYEDWVELYNASGATVDVSGMYLTDDMSDPTKWQIPATTTIAAGGYAVVWCDNEAGEGPLHATFRLGTGGEELALIDTDGATLLDFIHWGPQKNEVSFGRYADGKAYWRALPTPTQGAANVTTGNLGPAISWVESKPKIPRSTDPVKITCQVRDSDGLSAVELFWQVDGGGYTSASMTALGADRYGHTLSAQNDGALVEFYIAATDGLSLTCTWPQDAPAEVLSYVVVDPMLGDLRINEIMASNSSTVQDEAGDYEDWIELYNAGSSTLPLGGMYLTDDLADPTQWQIPSGTTLGAGQTLLFWADDEAGEGPLHTNFKLGAGGEEVGLFDTDANGNALVDGFAFSQQFADVGYGCLPDAGLFRFLLYSPSPDAGNRPPQGAAGEYEFDDPDRNVVALVSTSSPAINTSLGVMLAGGDPNNLGALAWGIVPTSIDLGTIGVTLMVPISALTEIYLFDGAGEHSTGLFVPNDSSLIGATLYAQGWGYTVTYSNGVALTIGS